MEVSDFNFTYKQHLGETSSWMPGAMVKALMPLWVFLLGRRNKY